LLACMLAQLQLFLEFVHFYVNGRFVIVKLVVFLVSQIQLFIELFNGSLFAYEYPRKLFNLQS
jgi:hypothetical protein